MIAPGGDGASREVPGTVPGKGKTQHHLAEPTSPREKGLAFSAFHILKLGLHEVGGSESSPLLWNVFPSSFQGGDGGQLRLE